MAIFHPNSNYTPSILLYLLLISSAPTSTLSFTNITAILSPYPDLSLFSHLLLSTAVANDLSSLSSLTLLALPNSILSSPTVTTPYIADIIRYHILLQYLSPSDLRRLPPAGRLITTLFQTTGRASDNFGSVNITRNVHTNSVTVSPAGDGNAGNVTVIRLIKSIPYNITIYSVNSLLFPAGIDLMASESQPSLGLNITKALIDGHNFNVAATMLEASGVSDELESDETGAGITLFIPTDESFADLPPNVKIQALTADKKAVLLKFHVLHSYYPLGSLESIVNPVQPTLATEAVGAGSYTLNISRVNGSVAINSGIVQASVTQTVFDEKPLAIFGVNRVLLPKEIFGNNPVRTSTPINSPPPPGLTVSPETKTAAYEPSSELSSPPVVETSDGIRHKGCERYIVGILLLYVLVWH